MIAPLLSILCTSLAFSLTSPASQTPTPIVEVQADPLSNEEAIRGLKAALEKGVSYAVDKGSAADGFFKNPAIFIPFPEEAQAVKKTALKVGMDKQVASFEETLNRAAEKAAAGATPIFLNAIQSMTIEDGFSILKGGDRAATDYLENTTRSQLRVQFQPVVKEAIEEVQLTKHWTPLASKYNKVPFAKKVDPDLEAYVTEKALDGLFVLVAEEEQMIRKDPAERTTDLLEKVFSFK